MKEVNEKTDCRFEYEAVKRGRRVVKIKFIYLNQDLPDFQTSFFDEQPTTLLLPEQNVNADPLSAAVDNALDFETIRLIAEKLKNKGIADNDVPKFLRELWLKLLREDKLKADTGKKPIRNKADYLISMTDNFKPSVKELADDSNSTISMDMYYETVNSFNPWDMLDEEDEDEI